MPFLPNLAPELIQHISNEVSFPNQSTFSAHPIPAGEEDLLTLRLVSKHLNTIIEPQALRSLALYILRDHLDAGQSLLTTLSSQSHHKATWATKNLRIAALCPMAYCTSGPPCCRWVEERSVWTVVRETEDDDPGKAKVVGEEMKRLIEGAVGSLRRLRSFWCVRYPLRRMPGLLKGFCRWSICLGIHSNRSMRLHHRSPTRFSKKT